MDSNGVYNLAVLKKKKRYSSLKTELTKLSCLASLFKVFLKGTLVSSYKIRFNQTSKVDMSITW
jgi:hypothetical protein